jgi:hypothetical protein
MPQKFIDQTTIQPDGKPGDDAFTAFEICNDNFQDAEARLVALEAGGGETGGRLDNEIAARTAADTALGARIDAANDRITSVDTKATDAGTAAETADGKAVAAQTTANAALPKTGGTITSDLYVQGAIVTGTAPNVNMTIASDASVLYTEAVNRATNTRKQWNAYAASFNLEVAGGVRVVTVQLSAVSPTVPAGLYAGYTLGRWESRPGDNSDALEMHYYREENANSTSWSAFNWRLQRKVDATPQQIIEFNRSGSLDILIGNQRFRFLPNGNATAPGSFINGGSDPQIKDPESLRPIQNATESLLGLNTRIGRYLESFGDGGKTDRAFVMADDAMREHTPEVIIEDVIQEKYAGWATDQLIAYLVAAHREGMERERQMQVTIDSLIDRIAVLEGGA